MNFYKGKCPECGKEVLLPGPSEKRFCGKVCEANYKFQKNRMLDLG